MAYPPERYARIPQDKCWCYLCPNPPTIEIRLRVPFPERWPVVKVCRDHAYLGIAAVDGSAHGPTARQANTGARSAVKSPKLT